MKSLAIHAALLPASEASCSWEQLRRVPASAKCMLDEGYGRHTSCEALYSEALAK
jgi:hypothetical protein